MEQKALILFKNVTNMICSDWFYLKMLFYDNFLFVDN